MPGNIFTKIKNLFTPQAASGDVSDVAIFSGGEAYWYTFKPIIEELIRRERPFHYMTLDKNDPALHIASEFMTSRYLGSGIMGFAKLSFCRAKILLATTPNIGTKGYPVIRPPHVQCLAHVFHCVGDISFYRKGSLDYYDAALMVGDFALDSIRRVEALRALPAKECVSVGLPYLDVLQAKAGQYNHSSPPGRAPVLLIAPSWGEKGFLSVYGTDFLRELAAMDFTMIIRPHPQSLKSEKKIVADLENALCGFDHVSFDFTVDGGPSMAQADVLISDSSSIRFDFAFIHERPVITLDIPERNLDKYERSVLKTRWESDLEREIGPMLTIADKPELSAKLKHLLTDISRFTPQSIASTRDAYISHFGQASTAICDWIDGKL